MSRGGLTVRVTRQSQQKHSTLPDANPGSVHRSNARSPRSLYRLESPTARTTNQSRSKDSKLLDTKARLPVHRKHARRADSGVL